jgi:hypothetical protein
MRALPCLSRWVSFFTIDLFVAKVRTPKRSKRNYLTNRLLKKSECTGNVILNGVKNLELSNH